MKILIVEDDEMIADVISRGLSRAGYQCLCAYDGLEAAGLLEEHRYDLILLDIMLPGGGRLRINEIHKRFWGFPLFLSQPGPAGGQGEGIQAGSG